jgi:hypothetical protein
MAAFIDMTGQRFGRWTVVERDETRKRKWLCRCECGTEKPVDGASLRSGASASCGGCGSPPCSKDDCDEPVHAQGLCNTHYRRQQRHGDADRTRQPHRAQSVKEAGLAEARAQMARWPETERTCNKCGETKSITEFAKGDRGHLRKTCKHCKAEQHHQWRAQNPEHVKEWHRRYGQTPERQEAHRTRSRHAYLNDPEPHRGRRRQSRYGITAEQYDAMLAAQGGVCAICGEVCKSGRSLAVDHDHVTGEVRGLLCGTCNRGIGYLKDDATLLKAALHYVMAHRDAARHT